MNPIKKFLKLESASGLVLFIAAALALLVDNSPWAALYDQITALSAGTINNGLMTLFFLVVGLELKRELFEGSLSNFSKILLPGLAALGGMIIPALIFLSINHAHPETLRGWPIPVATDIAFALGALSLFGKRIPIELKLFLLSLAIIDDLGAIIIIAFYHLESLNILWLVGAAFTTFILLSMNKMKSQSLFFYLIIGALLWFCLLKSSIHPTIAGVIVALATPASPEKNLANTLEDKLSPWVIWGIMPLFAFANSGISFAHLSELNTHLLLGIILGLCLGKQIGVFGSCALCIKLKLAQKPKGSSWLMLYGTSLLCGIGFTMSLFIGTLAFQNSALLEEVRLGVLSASLISGILGLLVLKIALR